MYSKDNFGPSFAILYLQRGKQMNAFPIAKSFTAVVIFLVALNGWSQAGSTSAASKEEGTEEKTKEECIKNRKNEKKCSKFTEEEDLNTCLNTLDRMIQNQCSDLPTGSSLRAECKNLSTEFEKLNTDIKKQCAQVGEKVTDSCKKKVLECGKNLNMAGTGEESNEASENENIFKSIYGIAKDKFGMSEGVEDQANCTVEDNEKEQDRSEQKIEKMSKLRADIASLREDAAKADDDVAKKKQDIEEKILEIEKEMTKKTIERKTEAQKETTKMQQDSLESIKRKKAALDGIDEKTTEIANMRITQQEEAIKFSQSNLMKACRDQALELKTKLIEAATKVASSNQGTATTGNIKKDVEIFAKQCIQLASVERSKALKSTQDRITRANRSVLNLKDVVKQEAESFAIRQKDVEAREKLATEEQTKAEEQRTKELTNLNQKVADMQQFTEKKKATYLEKIAIKEAEIKVAEVKLMNRKPKFQEIESSIAASSQKVADFVDQCCKDKSGFEGKCRQLKTDYPDEAAEVVIKPKKQMDKK